MYGVLGIIASIIAFSLSFTRVSPGINSASTVEIMFDEFHDSTLIGLAYSLLAIACLSTCDLVVSIYVKLVFDPAYDFRSLDRCYREWIGMFLHILAPVLSALPLVSKIDDRLKYRLYIYSFYAENFMAIMASFFTITNKHKIWNLTNGLIVQTLYFLSNIVLFISDHLNSGMELEKTKGYPLAVTLFAASFLYYCYLLILTYRDFYVVKDLFYSIVCPTIVLIFFYQSFVSNFVDTGKDCLKYVLSCQLLSILYLVINTIGTHSLHYWFPRNDHYPFFIGPSTQTRHEIMSTSFTAIKYASDTRHTIKQSLTEPLKEIQQRIHHLRYNELFEDQKQLDKLDMILNYIIFQLGGIDLNSKIADIIGDEMDSDTASLTDSRLSLFDENLLGSRSRMNTPGIEAQRENNRPVAPFNTSHGTDDDNSDVASTCTSNYLLLDKTETVKYTDYDYSCADMNATNSFKSISDNVGPSTMPSTIDMAYYLSIVNSTATEFIPITLLNEPITGDELCDFVAQVGFTQSSDKSRSSHLTRSLHIFRQYEHKICEAYNKYIVMKIKELAGVMGMGSALITLKITRGHHMWSAPQSRHATNSYSKRSSGDKQREVTLLEIIKTSSVIVARINQIMNNYHEFVEAMNKVR